MNKLELVQNPFISFVSSKNIFETKQNEQHKAPSLIRLSDGELLLTFALHENSNNLESYVVLTKSNDNGLTWLAPQIIYRNPGFTCINMGGLVKFSDDMIRLILGSLKIDYSLGGDEPFTDCITGFLDSKDKGNTWTDKLERIDLFPMWTEVYGQSNPHILKNGNFLLALMGTIGRDDQWHSGVSFCDPKDNFRFSKPVIIAKDKNRNYSDIDVVRVQDERLLAVIREHNFKKSVFSHSEDEGKTWSPINYTGFSGSNIKLFKLNSGVIICLYRDENPNNLGVSISITRDAGYKWEYLGQVYSAASDSLHLPGLKCGYPDMVYINDVDIFGVLHTYPDKQGRMSIQQFVLKDLT
ncbi:MAG: hypothetical protein CL758_01840 [Chloroflexi bacterium]|nr:hypothetical protein [Chloroflexota bacterium]|tara:strand:- start:3254 stop:4315 length:1062 start_codon:yes stop_codon:yes gene_type:complete